MIRKNSAKFQLFLLCALSLYVFSCKELIAQSAIVNAPTQSGTIGSIDIPSPGYFLMLRPWKKGTLATMDGKAQFAEISFAGDSQIKITPLIEFPRQRIDGGTLDTAPEAGVCVIRSGPVFHVADISTGKTKSYFAGLNWRWNESIPMVLDTTKGFVFFPFYSEYDNETTKPDYNIIYDPKNDKVLYESPEGGERIALICSFTPELVLSDKRINESINEKVLYNWGTREITVNELTKKLTAIETTTIFELDRNINIKERYLFASIRIPEEPYFKKIKITWDENYENIKVIPLDYLIPDRKYIYDFYFSANGKWATSFVGGYTGFYRESLFRRIFFHMDSRYPNGISMPIFTDDYYGTPGKFGSYVEHPEYGWCYADEKYKKDDKGKEKLYLRLYKMDDVLTEINRQVSEK